MELKSSGVAAFDLDCPMIAKPGETLGLFMYNGHEKIVMKGNLKFRKSMKVFRL